VSLVGVLALSGCGGGDDSDASGSGAGDSSGESAGGDTGGGADGISDDGTISVSLAPLSCEGFHDPLPEVAELPDVTLALFTAPASAAATQVYFAPPGGTVCGTTGDLEVGARVPSLRHELSSAAGWTRRSHR
jgi:hypothetical protein